MSGDTDIRVLLVSTNPGLVRELRDALVAIGSTGPELEVASSAHEAIVALRRLPADVTLVDIGGGGDQRMRELELVASTTADTVLIALTSSQDDRVTGAAFARGAQDCLIRAEQDLAPERLMRAIRKALARGAHDANRPLATLVELSSDAILTIDRGRLVTRFNEAAERLYGWTASEVLGRPARNLVPDESSLVVQANVVDRVFDGERVKAFEIARTTHDGRNVVMSMSGSPIVDAAGDVIEACLIIRDVTEERAEHAARRLAEQQLERAFDEALIGMVLLNMDGMPIRVNNALCEIFGRSREELLSRHFQEYTHPDDRGDDQPVMRILLSRAQKHHVREKRYVHADGHTIWAEVAVSLITYPDGTPSHMVGQIQDITERRAHVEQLRHMADHDPLTGLLNRRGFDRELAGHINRVQRYGVTGALLIFDLDNFKLHNDSYGHSAGDELLVALADGLRRRLRTSDVIGRLGGDEFAVLLPGATRARALLVADSLLEQIPRITSALPSAVGTGTTASIGLACFEHMRLLTTDAALRCADQAMYIAKHSGRNCCAEWDPDADRTGGELATELPGGPVTPASD